MRLYGRKNLHDDKMQKVEGGMEWNVERNMEWTMVNLSHKHANL